MASSIDLHVTVTRDKFEQLNMRLFRKTIEVVDNVLKTAKVSKDEVFNFESIRDVTPMSLGIESIINGVDGRFSMIILKNARMPCEATKSYFTVHEGQSRMRIAIYQGEDTVAKNNNLLGEFVLDNIPGEAGEQEVEVHMHVDHMGIIHVKAVCKSTNGSNEITVKEDKGRLTEAEKTQMKAKIAKPVKRPKNLRSK